MNYTFKNKAKYKNIKTIVDGHKFDSKKEASRYGALKMLLQSGEISDLNLQCKFEILPKQEGYRAINYFADFTYYENGVLIVEDVKGVKTQVYQIKKKLMNYFHNIDIRET